MGVVFNVAPLAEGEAEVRFAAHDKSGAASVVVADDNLWPDDIPLGEKNGMTLELSEDGSYHLFGSSQAWNSWQVQRMFDPGTYKLSKISSSGTGAGVAVLNYDGTKTYATNSGTFVLEERQSLLFRVYNTVLGDVDGTVRPKLAREDS